MHKELIQRLRETSMDFGEADHVSVMLLEAADAIEELSVVVRAQKAVLDKFPRWISVAEQLPEKAGKYLVCGRWRGKQAKIWVCEFMTLGCLKGWVNSAAYPSVSHWMPIPEPPKEV